MAKDPNTLNAAEHTPGTIYYEPGPNAAFWTKSDSAILARFVHTPCDPGCMCDQKWAAWCESVKEFAATVADPTGPSGRAGDSFVVQAATCLACIAHHHRDRHRRHWALRKLMTPIMRQWERSMERLEIVDQLLEEEAADERETERRRARKAALAAEEAANEQRFAERAAYLRGDRKAGRS
jgi:hypothetical protein